MALTAQRQRLARLRRLERMRAIHHREAMVAAGMAENTLAKLQQLAQRTETLADAYAARTDAVDGAALAQIGAFRTGLGQIARTTGGEIDTARRIADARAADVAATERRRSAVADRIAAATEAGGELVDDTFAPAFWVLADPQGNRACLTTWQGRESPRA